MGALWVSLAVVIAFAGFGAARFFRMRRWDRSVEERIQRKDAQSRRHHFRGIEDDLLENRPESEQ